MIFAELIDGCHPPSPAVAPKLDDLRQPEHVGASKSMDMRIVIQNGGKPSRDALGLVYEQNAHQSEWQKWAQCQRYRS